MKLIALAVLGSLLFSCNTQINDSYSDIEDVSGDLALTMVQEHPGKKLMENNCYVCHNPKTSETDMIAPPMIAVKKHYISENTSKEEFVDAMVNWTKKPSEEKTKMPGAIRKFDLMPYQFYPEVTIREIADYIFSNEIEEPIWFKEHYKKMRGDGSKMKGKMGHQKKMHMDKS